jgi:hypothetical protein
MSYVHCSQELVSSKRTLGPDRALPCPRSHQLLEYPEPHFSGKATGITRGLSGPEGIQYPVTVAFLEGNRVIGQIKGAQECSDCSPCPSVAGCPGVARGHRDPCPPYSWPDFLLLVLQQRLEVLLLWECPCPLPSTHLQLAHAAYEHGAMDLPEHRVHAWVVT